MNKFIYADAENIALEKAEKIVELSTMYVKDKASTSISAKERFFKEAESAGIKLKSNTPLLQLSDGNTAAGDAKVGVNTFSINNELIQDFSPEMGEASPLNVMLPFKNVDTVTVQQDMFGSNYGWAKPANGYGGAFNHVPLLDVSGRQFDGFMYNVESHVEGVDLVSIRELGVSDTKSRGIMQRITMQQILLMQQLMTSIEMQRIETLIKGSFVYHDSNVGTPIPSDNIYSASQSLGTYDTATNKFTLNPALTANLFNEIGIAATRLKNMGLELEGILMSNIVYQALIESPAIDAKTIYTSAVSSNNVQDIRDNVFRMANIPALQDLPIIVDNRAVKINSGKTSPLNTRPILWGETVTPASFRAIFLVRPKALSRVGYMGFFPNVYNRGGPAGATTTRAGFEGNIQLVTQDMSQFNWQDQRIQLLGTACYGPMIYQNNAINVFDFGVTVTP